MAKDKPKKVVSLDEKRKQKQNRTNVKDALNKIGKEKANKHKPGEGENQEV